VLDIRQTNTASIVHGAHGTLGLSMLVYLVYDYVVINVFNFKEHYKSPPFHTVIRIHFVSLISHILVCVIFLYFHGANVSKLFRHPVLMCSANLFANCYFILCLIDVIQ